MLLGASQPPVRTSRFTKTIGNTMNSPTARTTPRIVAMKEIADMRLICSFSSHHFSNLEGFPSSPYTSALRIRIFDPVTREETKLTTPRTSGIFATRFMPLEAFSLRLST